MTSCIPLDVLVGHVLGAAEVGVLEADVGEGFDGAVLDDFPENFDDAEVDALDDAVALLLCVSVATSSDGTPMAPVTPVGVVDEVGAANDEEVVPTVRADCEP